MDLKRVNILTTVPTTEKRMSLYLRQQIQAREKMLYTNIISKKGGIVK